MKPLLIIHGWSDEADSFIPLAEALESKTGRTVEQVWLGNYISLDDDVRMKDLVLGLSRAWKERKLPTNPKSVDVIIHSTGGLVIRDWMYSVYTSNGKKPPVNNLVMLAPANFGSPLAHKGRARYGRVIKGFNSSKRFETGTHILKALEMASPYTWELAKNDRFNSNLFSPNGVRTTVIVGNTGYSGISALANEDGSDGTVYVSTASMECEHVVLEFPPLPKKPRLKSQKVSTGLTALLVMDGFNHSTIALKDDDNEGNTTLLNKITKAVSVSNAMDFNKWVKNCAAYTRAVMREKSDEGYKHGYQNTVFRVRDDQGFDVTDYVIEFYNDVGLDLFDRFAEIFNKDVVSTVHAYKDNSAYRSFMVDCTLLYDIIDEEGENLRISLSAMPDFNDSKNMVGYRTFGNDDIDYIELSPGELKKFFKPNRTLLIDIILKREQKNEIFSINRLDELN